MPAERPQRVLALCADDFGLTRGISQGIARLARAGRLTATSCITNAPQWRPCAPMLADLPPSVDIGLHINLTEGEPLSAALRAHWPTLPPLPQLIMRAHLGLLPWVLLREEIRAQRRAFETATGAQPRHLDGHEHVHHLPGVRDLVLEMAASMAPRPAVRNTAVVLGPGFAAKRWLICRTGGRALGAELSRQRLAHNPVLLGAYDFQDPDYRARMRAWLDQLPARGGLLFCHPGEMEGGSGGNDPIAGTRVREMAYLDGEQFREDLETAGVTFGRVWATA